MPLHSLFDSLKSTTTQSGQKVTYYSLPALEDAGVGPISKLPVSIRIVLEAVLRNFDGKRVSEHDVRTLANWNAKNPVSGGNSLRRRAHRAAGFHRRAAAGRSRRHAPRGGEAEEKSQADRAARAGRSRRRSLRAGRRRRHAGRAAAQPRVRVRPQPRALRVPQVGPAGVRDLQGRAARHRHRPPGQSRVPRQGRALARRSTATRFIIPTRSSAPTRTRP